MSHTYVFLGPSLPLADARAICPDATYLPPVKAGDVTKLTEDGARVIAIIDGFFEQVPSVWHKEILYALSRGVHVLGASSMGALRAAELAAFGMVGVGRIFEDYRDGRLTDDDEVTVIHGPASAGFRPLSDAMVNLRHGLAEARRATLIGERTHDVLVAALKRTHYPERTWALVPELAAVHDLPAAEAEALVRWVRAGVPNRKGLDAKELLSRLPREMPAPFVAAFDFEPTAFFNDLAASVRSVPVGETAVPIEALQSHVAVVEPDAGGLMESALFLYLVVAEAERSKVAVDGATVAAVAERFRRRHGLVSAAATHAWLAENGLDGAGFSKLMELLATIEAVLAHHASAVSAFLPAELLRRGSLGAATRAVQQKSDRLAALGVPFPSPEDVGTTAPELIRWYEATFRRLEAPLRDHSRTRGVLDPARFLREIVAEYVARGQAFHA